MGDWETKILPGLRQSRLMLAVLSPAYFTSEFCQREWDVYVESELKLAVPEEGIIPIYTARYAAFETDPIEEAKENWIKDLRRRWFIDWLSYWPKDGVAFLPDEVQRNLAGLPGQIAERLRRAALRDGAPSTVPLPGPHFVGRRDEMHALLGNLIECQKCVITASGGVPAIGTSTLAFAYAWGYGYKYPGGRYLIGGANLGDLAAGVIALAKAKGVAFDEQDRKSPPSALAKVKTAFEEGPPALLVIDNIDDPGLFSEQARDRALPSGDHLHVLATTRLEPTSLPGLPSLTLHSLAP